MSSTPATKQRIPANPGRPHNRPNLDVSQLDGVNSILAARLKALADRRPDVQFSVKGGSAYANGKPLEQEISAATLTSFGLNPNAGSKGNTPPTPLGNTGGTVSLSGAFSPDGTASTAGSATTSSGADSGLSATLSGVPVVGGALGAAGSVVDTVTGAAAGAGSSAATALVKGLFNLIAPDGARILLYLALVLGGAAAIVTGISRATGLRSPIPIPKVPIPL